MVTYGEGQRGEKGNQGNQGFRGHKGDPGATGAQGPRARRRKINYAQTGVYVGLVLVLIFALFLDASNHQEDQRERCEAGVDSREVQRDLVDAVFELAAGIAQRDADSPPLTDAEIVLYNAYVARLNRFRSESYAKIKPSSLCEPYVEDDVVLPPSPPLEPIRKNKKKG